MQSSDLKEPENSSPGEITTRIAVGLVLLVGILVSASAIQTAWTYYAHAGKSEASKTYLFQIDLRTASSSELLLIPGFGQTLSSRWIEQRDELLKHYPEPMVALSHMRGIGKQKLEAIRPFVVEHASKQQSVELVRSNSQVVQP